MFAPDRSGSRRKRQSMTSWLRLMLAAGYSFKRNRHSRFPKHQTASLGASQTRSSGNTTRALKGQVGGGGIGHWMRAATVSS